MKRFCKKKWLCVLCAVGLLLAVSIAGILWHTNFLSGMTGTYFDGVDHAPSEVLEIWLEKDRITTKEPYITVHVRNTGDRDLYNYGFALRMRKGGTWYYPDKKENYVELAMIREIKAGETISHKIPAKGYGRFLPPGEYGVTFKAGADQWAYAEFEVVW